LAELIAQAILHFMLIRVNPVLRQPTGLDIPVEQDDVRPLIGQLFGGIQTCRACPNHSNQVVAPRLILHNTSHSSLKTLPGHTPKRAWIFDSFYLNNITLK
jgi:hypothetical protein